MIAQATYHQEKEQYLNLFQGLTIRSALLNRAYKRRIGVLSDLINAVRSSKRNISPPNTTGNAEETSPEALIRQWKVTLDAIGVNFPLPDSAPLALGLSPSTQLTASSEGTFVDSTSADVRRKGYIYPSDLLFALTNTGIIIIVPVLIIVPIYL